MSQTSHGDSMPWRIQALFEQLEGEKTGTKTYVQPQLVHTSIRAVVRVFQYK